MQAAANAGRSAEAEPAAPAGPSTTPARPSDFDTSSQQEQRETSNSATSAHDNAQESTADANRPAAPAHSIVVTPSRLRIDSKVLVAHTTIQWLTNAIFCILILFKLNGILASTSWWYIFAPTWANHALHIPLQIVVLWATESMILRQIGPAPPATATAGLHLQYSMVLKTRARSHVIDTTNALIESVAMLVAKVLFCWLLETNQLGTISLRAIFTPFWVSWFVTTVLNCMKDRAERVVGSSRDLLYVFLLFVAFQVDDKSGYSWRVVFVVPWIWFCSLFLLAWVVLTLLLFARVWARMLELLLPISFFLLLVSTVPQFISYINLVKLLDGEADVSLESILIPNAVSWLAMWLSSLLLGWGLRQKERIRDALLASGAVWTMHEQVARRLRYQDQEAVRQKIDRMSEEEVARLVEEMMAGKSKPLQLVRVGNTLYRRLTGESMVPEPEGAGHGQGGDLQLVGAESVSDSGEGEAGRDTSERTGSWEESDVSRGGASGSVQAGAGRGLGGRGGVSGSSSSNSHFAPPPATLMIPVPGKEVHAGQGLGQGEVVPAASPPGLLDEEAGATTQQVGRSGSRGRGAGPGPGSISPDMRLASPINLRPLSASPHPRHLATIPSTPSSPSGSSCKAEEVRGSRGAAALSLGSALHTSLHAASGESAAPNAGGRQEGAEAGSPRSRPPRPRSALPTTASAASPAASTSTASTSLHAAADAGGGGGGAMRRASFRLADSDSRGPRHSVSGIFGLVSSMDENLGMLGPGTPSARVIPEVAEGGEGEAGREEQAAAGRGEAGDVAIDASDDTCIICYDAEATCVLLDCGHGGFCKRCAYLMYVRPPGECPTCRAPIEQVVQLAGLIPIGAVSSVK